MTDIVFHDFSILSMIEFEFYDFAGCVGPWYFIECFANFYNYIDLFSGYVQSPFANPLITSLLRHSDPSFIASNSFLCHIPPSFLTTMSHISSLLLTVSLFLLSNPSTCKVTTLQVMLYIDIDLYLLVIIISGQLLTKLTYLINTNLIV